MSKYYGAVGYAIPCETTPGVWEDKIIEKNLSWGYTSKHEQMATIRKFE